MEDRAGRPFKYYGRTSDPDQPAREGAGMTAVVVKAWGNMAAAHDCLVDRLELTALEAEDVLSEPLPWIIELSDESAAALTRCLRARAGATVVDAPVAVSI
jgi:hypothetical protein